MKIIIEVGEAETNISVARAGTTDSATSSTRVLTPGPALDAGAAPSGAMPSAAGQDESSGWTGAPGRSTDGAQAAGAAPMPPSEGPAPNMSIEGSPYPPPSY